MITDKERKIMRLIRIQSGFEGLVRQLGTTLMRSQGISEKELSEEDINQIFKGVWEIFDLEGLLQALVPDVAKCVHEEDVDKLVMFFGSPAYQRFQSAGPKIIEATEPFIQTWIKNRMPELKALAKKVANEKRAGEF